MHLCLLRFLRQGRAFEPQGGLIRKGFEQVQLLRGWRPITESTDDKPWTITGIDGIADALFEGNDRGTPPFMPEVSS